MSVPGVNPELGGVGGGKSVRASGRFKWIRKVWVLKKGEINLQISNIMVSNMSLSNLNYKMSVGYLSWEGGCVLLCDYPREQLHFLGQTPPLEGDTPGSYRYTHSVFEHLKYSSTPVNTCREDI